MDSYDVIEQEFKAGELDVILAIERLQALGWLPKDAEDLVDKWENEGVA